ncbi:MAG: hypothetical protein PHX05_03915 [Acidobacteriota bacterium]|nr:hypothetical protein [Acidobacteriota bacterium]
MIEKIWLELPDKYPGVTLDEFVIMPNHVHGILGIYVGAGPCACPSGSSDRKDMVVQKDMGRTRGAAPTKNHLSLPDVIRQFKTLTCKKIQTALLIPIGGNSKSVFGREIISNILFAVIRNWIKSVGISTTIQRLGCWMTKTPAELVKLIKQ